MSSISIIIPTCNESARIATAVDRALSLRPREVIVVDGGSEDETVARATAAHADRILVTTRGRGTQLNAGAGVARGDILLFLHADCWLEPDGFLQLVQSVTAEQALWGGFRQIIDGQGLGYRLLEQGNAWRTRWPGWFYGDQGIFVTKSLFESLGGFPPLPLMEDLYFSKRLTQVQRGHLLGRYLHVDPRRWERHGLVRQTLRNWWFLARVSLGASIDQLAEEYRQVR